MNTTAAAIEARVTVATIRTWCRRGVIAATKTAGQWVIDTASLARRITIGATRKPAAVRITAEAMVAIGGRRWQKGSMDRVYINNWHDFAGITVSRYASGGIASAGIEGLGGIANSRAHNLLNAIDKVWFDAADGQLHCTHYGAREYEIRLHNGNREYVDFVARLFAGITAAVAAL